MDAKVIAEALAAAFLDGEWSAVAMAKRGEHALGRWRQLRKLAGRAVAAFPDAPRDRFDELAAMLADDRWVGRASSRDAPTIHLAFVAPELAMRDAHPEWGLPRLDTVGDLAAWLDLTPNDLLWLADPSGFARRARAPALLHYTHRWLPKRSGGRRLVEAPKRSLKEVQRRLLHGLVARLPPHDAAHGFVRGRSILTHAAPHAGKPVVLRLDFADFFPSIPVARVVGVFAACGYSRSVARLLASLCTTFCPQAPRYGRHLPQGAPTSPALANLCARGLDVRLTVAAAQIGATYTRYADDLVFSGDIERRAGRFAALVAAIAQDEGFVPNHRKTRLMRDGVRQVVTGLVVNARPTVPRPELERLEAILFNSVRHGPTSQNREAHPDFRAHLCGKIAWVRQIVPARATRLTELFSAIDWHR